MQKLCWPLETNNLAYYEGICKSLKTGDWPPNSICIVPLFLLFHWRKSAISCSLSGLLSFKKKWLSRVFKPYKCLFLISSTCYTQCKLDSFSFWYLTWQLFVNKSKPMRLNTSLMGYLPFSKKCYSHVCQPYKKYIFLISSTCYIQCKLQDSFSFWSLTWQLFVNKIKPKYLTHICDICSVKMYESLISVLKAVKYILSPLF